MTSDKNNQYNTTGDSSTFKHSVPVLVTLFLIIVGFGLLGLGAYALFQLRPDFETQRQTHQDFLENKRAAAEILADKYRINSVKEVVESDSSTIKTYADFQNYVKSVTTKKGGYQRSLFDIIGTEVKTPTGESLGIIEDVFLYIRSGKPQVIIANENGRSYIKNLRSLTFDKAFGNPSNEKKAVTINEAQFDDKADIYDATLTAQDQISLKRLRQGRVLDFEGGFISKSRTIIYGNAETQGIYFNLCPLTKKNEGTPLRMPLKGLRFVKNSKGIDIALTEEQTFSLAKWCS